MTNEEIPSKIWALKNELIDAINTYANSNYCHQRYKEDWDDLGDKMKRLGGEIQRLASQYVQPEVDY